MCSPHSSLSLTCLGQGIDYIAPPGLTLEKQIRMTHQGPWLAFRQMPTDPRISRILWRVCLISIISLRITSILKSSKRQNKCSKIILNLFQVYICISGIPLMFAHFTQFNSCDIITFFFPPANHFPQNSDRLVSYISDSQSVYP